MTELWKEVNNDDNSSACGLCTRTRVGIKGAVKVQQEQLRCRWNEIICVDLIGGIGAGKYAGDRFHSAVNSR